MAGQAPAYGANGMPFYGSTASAYGSTGFDLGAPTELKMGGPSFPGMESIGFMTTPPFVIYTLMTFTFAVIAASNFLIAAIVGCFCFGMSLLFFFSHSHNKEGGPIYLYVGVLCLVATFSGLETGGSIHARYYGPYGGYKNRPEYSDVVPTDPAASREDGGIINFASNAVVDTTRMGNMRSIQGIHFCVAPILDESQQSQAQFWAVGMDCCIGRVSFFCDDAQDVSAKTGMVVFNFTSYDNHNDPYKEFQKAVKQAAARNQLTIPDSPVLVRWVKDVDEQRDSLWWEGTLHMFFAILFYGFASVSVAVGLHYLIQRQGQSRPPGSVGQSGPPMSEGIVFQ
jgi:hypothetical protein